MQNCFPFTFSFPSPSISNKEAYTPLLGATQKIMTVTHTPILGQNSNIQKQFANETVQSGAGFKIRRRQTVQIVQLDDKSDSRKPARSHGSPKHLNTLSLDKSPMMVNGRWEQLDNIFTIILKLEEEEEGAASAKEGKEKEGAGGKRRSQRISELCGQRWTE